MQDSHWTRRVPIKIALMAIVVLLVCYPDPRYLWWNIQHWRAPNDLIDPEAVLLRPWMAELRPSMKQADAGPDALKLVETFVYRKVPYAWDWDTWGVADYMPSVDETILAGREDCDGRAVVAASMLRGFGFQADLVTDGTHVWVRTDQGETMSPGRSPKIIETKGEEVRIAWRNLFRLPRAFAFGLSVFPLGREIIVIAAYWLLTLRMGMGRFKSLGCLAIMIVGLVLLRQWTTVPPRFAAVEVFQRAAAAVMLTGAIALYALGRGAARRSKGCPDT